MLRVLVIGGYGNFGGYIARALARDAEIQLIIGGRSMAKADAFAKSLNAMNPAERVALDINGDLRSVLQRKRVELVVHTTGPFQTQDSRVARAAVSAGAHYVDLSDARAFVARIGELDQEAKAAGVCVITGASSVPCLTAAFIDHCRPFFGKLTSAEYGISAAQATNRGLGTAAAILSYVGKPFTRLKRGRPHRAYGWQGLTAVRYPELGLRLFGDCDIPDLELFPERYPDLQDLRFVAGHEIKSLHLGTWLLSWLVRLRIIPSLRPHAKWLLRASFLFDRLGTDRSGFHLKLGGIGQDGEPMHITGFMIARQGHGPNIPCMPAILLARRIARGRVPPTGARACLDLITLNEYLEALGGLDVRTVLIGPGMDDQWPSKASV